MKIDSEINKQNNSWDKNKACNYIVVNSVKVVALWRILINSNCIIWEDGTSTLVNNHQIMDHMTYLGNIIHARNIVLTESKLHVCNKKELSRVVTIPRYLSNIIKWKLPDGHVLLLSANVQRVLTIICNQRPFISGSFLRCGTCEKFLIYLLPPCYAYKISVNFSKSHWCVIKIHICFYLNCGLSIYSI